MSYLLYIESATEIGSVALFEDEKLLGSIDYRKAKTHSRLLTSMIQTLLKDMEISPEMLDAIGVSKGPGSYTGLRVGVSTAKGLCMALDKPLLAMGSLETLAWSIQNVAQAMKAWICPMIDARRMEVYCAFFNENLQEMRPTQAEIITEGHFETLLAQQKVLFIGDGAAKCMESLSFSPNAIVLSNVLSSAQFVGKALFYAFQQQKFEDLMTFEPFYLKNYVATEQKKGKVEKAL